MKSIRSRNFEVADIEAITASPCCPSPANRISVSQSRAWTVPSRFAVPRRSRVPRFSTLKPISVPSGRACNWQAGDNRRRSGNAIAPEPGDVGPFEMQGRIPEARNGVGERRRQGGEDNDEQGFPPREPRNGCEIYSRRRARLRSSRPEAQTPPNFCGANAKLFQISVVPMPSFSKECFGRFMEFQRVTQLQIKKWFSPNFFILTEGVRVPSRAQARLGTRFRRKSKLTLISFFRK